ARVMKERKQYVAAPYHEAPCHEPSWSLSKRFKPAIANDGEASRRFAGGRVCVRYGIANHVRGGE
ncbi:MAG: hypothetical protein KDA59_06205, partial [Planctomycetales bacterium]|nr:hypothetical protein [Planctomycetales bacterium]